MSSLEEAIYGKKKKKKTKRKLTKADQDKVLKRQEYRCARCKDDISKIRARTRFDHKKPLALGGSDTLRNYQALCAGCHAEKTREDRSKIAKHKRKIAERKRKEEIPFLLR